MSLRINDEAPNFTAHTTQGEINFHEWIGDGWAILFRIRRTLLPFARRNWAIWPDSNLTLQHGTARSSA